MTATLTPTTTSAPASAGQPVAAKPIWRAGVAAGLAAAAATVAVAGIAHAAGVSLETAPGEAIPVLGFGQLTLFFTAIGVLIAKGIRRRARQPRSTFTRTTVALTALSVVPDMVISAGVSTKATLVLTHLVAAAIVIPALSARLPEASTR
jgi:uncharacterized protein DUF6069